MIGVKLLQLDTGFIWRRFCTFGEHAGFNLTFASLSVEPGLIPDLSASGEVDALHLICCYVIDRRVY